MSAVINNRLIDSELVLKQHSATPITTTTAETAILVYPRNHLNYKAIIDIGAYAATGTYELTIEVSDALNGTYSTMSVLTDAVIKNNGQNSSFELPLSGHQAFATDADCLYVRINATLGGTTPSLAYGSFLTVI